MIPVFGLLWQSGELGAGAGGEKKGVFAAKEHWCCYCGFAATLAESLRLSENPNKPLGYASKWEAEPRRGRGVLPGKPEAVRGREVQLLSYLSRNRQ